MENKIQTKKIDQNIPIFLSSRYKCNSKTWNDKLNWPQELKRFLNKQFGEKKIGSEEL